MCDSLEELFAVHMAERVSKAKIQVQMESSWFSVIVFAFWGPAAVGCVVPYLIGAHADEG